MSNARWERVKKVLYEALQLAPGQRAGFLDSACAADAAMRTEIQAMLEIEAAMRPDFLALPPITEPGVVGEGGSGLSEGQIFAARFRLIRRLGEGGMGQVWLAEQVEPVRREVALKLIKAGMYDHAMLQRFQSERQSLAIMDHPAIAKVFDAGATPLGQPYFVMEYVPGLPITEYCDQHRLKIRERLDLFIQTCEGVQHAHQKAIIHRDLKPANILVVELDGRPVPRIIDFGLAKASAVQLTEETRHTRFGQFLGTPGYMSPEQVDPNIRDIDTRTDVYSLGVILYVLLTGLQPFETKRREKPALDVWLRQLREEEPPAPSAKLSTDRDTARAASAARGTEPKRLASELKGDLDWIATKALDRDRERRYGAPAELAADLRRYLNHEPVTARPASASYQLSRFIRRHRIGAGFVGMVTVLSIAAFIAALIAVRKQHEAEYQSAQTLQAQARLLTQAAAQHLKDSDVAGAQGIILEVLAKSEFAQTQTAATISAFQDIRAADLQLAVLSGHRGIVRSAAFSPDGTRIASGSDDKTARIWDAATGAQLAVLSGHGASVRSIAYSPDGLRVVTASYDKTARIWDAPTGGQLTVLSGHGDGLNSAAYSPDGTRIVTTSNDGTARIWAAQTGAQLAILAGHKGFVYSAAYSPDGARMVTASADNTARIWDVRTGAQLAVLSGHSNSVNSAAYSPDGTRIVTTSNDKTARIWDAVTAVQLAVLAGHNGFVYSAAFSPDGTRIVTASYDKTARTWSARTGELLAILSGRGGSIHSAAYSPDGTRIITTSRDNTARIWNASVRAQIAVLSGHGDNVYGAAYSPDGQRIVTASRDKTARIWDARTHAQLAVLSGHADEVMSAAYSPDGARIVTTSDDKTARIWDAASGAQLAVLQGHAAEIESAGYSPDGTRIVTASDDKTARIWDARTGVQLTVLDGHRSGVYSATYSPDGRRIVTASADNTARIWDSRTGAQLAVLSGHGDLVNCASYSPDGTRIVTASADRTARIWDAQAGRSLAVLSGHGDRVFFSAYSPDGTRIVTASDDRSARIWDARTGAQLAALPGHSDIIYSAQYSPDGMHIVTASGDKTTRIWDANVQGTLAAQILWDASAETDPLLDADRVQLGLLPAARSRSWSTQASDCDRAAAAVHDPDRVTAGVLLQEINVDVASVDCASEIAKADHGARLDYQMGRALSAKGDTRGAKRQFELATARGYRAARVDLADLLVSAPVQNVDSDIAAALYERAWQDGVPVAAFRMGQLYERGWRAPADPAKAWLWFQKGAEAGEPNALARFAERDERDALAQTDPSKRSARLLQAFRYYAAAAERAHEEDWPDDAWKHWRYRRATLARLLAQEGMMQQVADAYTAILHMAISRPPPLWQRFAVGVFAGPRPGIP